MTKLDDLQCGATMRPLGSVSMHRSPSEAHELFPLRGHTNAAPARSENPHIGMPTKRTLRTVYRGIMNQISVSCASHGFKTIKKKIKKIKK
jgi:hypothetical protein